MRVAMFSRFPADADQPKGGVESATVGIARGLGTRADVDLHIVTLEKGRNDDAVEDCGFATVHRLAGGRLPMIVDVFNGPGRRKVDRYIRGLNPDVVHFQETYGFGGPVKGVPTVFTVHGFDSLNLVTERQYLWYLRAPLWRLAEKKGISSHRHLVSIAPYVTEQLRELGLSAEIVSIPNAISREFFSVPDATVPGRVLFAGWINPRKNLATAISAASAATTVLPDPTSPCTRRSMGTGRARSAAISSITRCWAPVSWKPRLSRNARCNTGSGCSARAPSAWAWRRSSNRLRWWASSSSKASRCW